MSTLPEPSRRPALTLAIAMLLTACAADAAQTTSPSVHAPASAEASADAAGSDHASPASERPSDRFAAHPREETDAPLGYYEYLPPGYGDGEASPLLVFVHGIGESGDGSGAELGRLLATGIPALIDADRWPADRPFVVLAPQHDEPADDAPYAACERGETWGPCVLRLQHELGHPADGSVCMTPTELEGFIGYAIASYDVDPKRVYLTGLSCGSFASFEYVAVHGASQVAAMVVIAGDGRPAWEEAGCELGQVAIWGFHGDADDDVAEAGTIEPITNLMDCPAPPRQEVKLTVYPGVHHDSWTRTYDGSAGHEIYEWLLGFTLP